VGEAVFHHLESAVVVEMLTRNAWEEAAEYTDGNGSLSAMLEDAAVSAAVDLGAVRANLARSKAAAAEGDGETLCPTFSAV
jgi:hypothetical protein